MKIKNIFLCITAIYSLLISPILINIPAHAMESEKVDLIAPTIIHTVPAGRFFKVEIIGLSAIITDNQKVVSATLFFRTEGEKEYHSIEMVSKKNEEYFAEIPGWATKGLSIEYYIEAIDDAENHTIKGFSTSPMVILISDQPASPKINPNKPEDITTQQTTIIQPDEVLPLEQPAGIQFEKSTPLEAYKTTDVEKSKPETHNLAPWYKQWWVWTIAGVVIIGAAASSGGGGGGSTETTTGTVNVSVPSP